MNFLRKQANSFLLLLSCLFSIKVSSTQDGSSYFFYQQPEYPRDCKEAREQCSSDIVSGVYSIKPDGYPQPFEVYCNNDISSDGWTVIQRRIDGSVTFRRDWDTYKNGFGFLSTEFWIGNEKLSYLTNQAVYELRIDMVLSNGSYSYIKYNSFRISDEWSQYALVNVEEFSGNTSCVVSTCPSETTHGGCTCQRVCSNPIGMIDCNDACEETCIPNGCFVSGSLISNGESFINDDCTQNCTCTNNQLNCNPDYQCSSDATCLEKDGVRRCYCNEGYGGSGETCTRNVTVYRDCYDVYQADNTVDGVYSVLPSGWTGPAFDVFCNMTIAGGGWTVFQRRTDGVTDFYLDWADYKEGFGSKIEGNDFWLGNEQLYYLTNQKDYILRIDIVTSGGTSYYDEYSSFRIGDESTKYQLNYGSFSRGDLNGLSGSNGKQFSTRDQDNDGCSFHDYAEGHKGAWWYTTTWCRECFFSGSFCYYFETRSGCTNFGTVSNLNGDYNGGNGQNIFYDYGRCNIRFAEMKIRPSSV